MTYLTNWPLLSISISSLLGIGLGTGFPSLSAVACLIAAAVLALAGIGLSLLNRPSWWVIPLAGLLIVAGAGRAVVARSLDQVLTDPIDLVEARAVVVSAPEQVDTYQRAYVDMEIEGRTERLRARWISQAEPVQYGAVLHLTGTAQPPRVELDFDERGFLLAHGTAGTIDVHALQRTDEVAGHPILRSIHHIRTALLDRLHRSLPPPQRQIVSGVLLGERSGLGDELEAAFRRTGTTHILVASGTNVSILAMILAGVLLTWLGRKLTAGALTLFLVTFVVASGADASVIRASVFFAFIVLASLVGRRVHGSTLIAFVALVMVWLNPWILLGDIAFQLSFAAIVGLMQFSAWFEELLPPWFLPAVLGPTLAAQLTTLPVLMYHFGQASLIAPVANLVAVPMVEGLMLGGILSVIAPWSVVFPQATSGAASALVWAIRWLAHIPWATVTFPAGQWLWTGLACLLIGVVVVIQRRRTQSQTREETHAWAA